MPKRFDRSVADAEQALFRDVGAAQVPAATTQFFFLLGAQGNAPSEADANARPPIACKFKNLVVRTKTAQPATGSLVIRLRKNGADTPLSVTVPAGAAAGHFRNDVNIVDADVGDDLCWAMTNNAAALSATVPHIGVAVG